ncbi:MAG: fused MFS/spermidine synthase, partial [Flavobacteriales bacterium]
GLGIGYLFGGKLADRSAPERNLRYFVLAELGILLFALVSKVLLYDGLYAIVPATSSPVVLYALLFVVLLVPTFLMGVSLPVLSKAFRFGAIADQARFIGHLYFVNTLGAAIGALVTGVFLVRILGYEHTILVGAVLNGCCAIGALLLGLRKAPTGETANAAASLPAPLVLSKRFMLWCGHYALSGFAALTMELIWFRVLGSLIKSIAITFSILLTIYLGCMAIGTYVGTRIAKRRASDAVERLFLQAQILLYIYTGLAFVVFVALLGRWAPLDLLWAYFRSYEPDLTPRILLSTHVLVPLVLMSPPTFLMGLSFSLSQALLQDKFEEVGRKVGWLHFINIVGSALGACWVTWFGFEVFGTAVLLKIVVALGLCYVFALYARRRATWLLSGFSAVALVAVVILLPGTGTFWLRLNGLDQADRFIIDENGSGLSIVKLMERDGEQVGVVFANGLGQSRMPYRTDPTHIDLGAIPVLLHPDPQAVAVIGMGSGGTLYGAAARPQTTALTCFEIMSNQPKVLQDYADRVKDVAVDRILDDPRLTTVVNDGRYELRVGNARYDIIEADALRPNSAFSGNIYSAEYFALVRDRLKSNGWVVSWCPTPRVLSTFCSVFPYVAYSDALLLIGSMEPIILDWERLDARLKDPFTRRHFELADVDIAAQIEPFKTSLQVIDPAAHVGSGVNTDLFPKDEFQLPYSDELIKRKLGLD